MLLLLWRARSRISLPVKRLLLVRPVALRCRIIPIHQQGILLRLLRGEVRPVC
jgi:hypothetical protein